MSTSVAATAGYSGLILSLMDFSFQLPSLTAYTTRPGQWGQGVAHSPSEAFAPLVQLPPQSSEGSEAAESPLQGLPSSFISNLSTPTTLPRSPS
ncbi:zinc finger protein PLAG1 [Lates japonicus]|uniref:Zinc finger protein PLAG1 n=1 Tax=Lates japonicus TaxID=270547 RepID=A0AAD3MJG4_LATJO|nr:zinc finger protein PLAG1 [Lates japonicus]